MEEKKKKEENNKKKIKKELEEFKKERDEYLAGWQRTQADFVNYKKKQMENLENARGAAKKEILLEVLEVFDLFELAKKEIPEGKKDSEWVEGILKIEDQFKKFLKSRGVEELNPIDEEFDPNFHEAVEQVESDKKSDIVVEVLKKGYTKEGQLLRPARVKVST